MTIAVSNNTDPLDRYPSIQVSDARASIPNLVERVAAAGERHILTRHGRPVAAVICMPDLMSLEDADLRSREELSWPEEGVGQTEDTVLSPAIGTIVTDAEMHVEFEDLVRRTMQVVTHDPKLKSMMVDFLTREKEESESL